MTNYKLDWTKVGADYNGSDQLKSKLLAAVAAMDAQSTGPGEWDRWLEIPKDGSALAVGFMPGEGIKETIKELNLPRVTHIAISARLSPMGFYGIRAHYKSGTQTVEVFVIDSGESITPVLARVWDVEQKEAIAEPISA